MEFGEPTGPSVKVCCGPRCGQEPGHRAIYAAVETHATLPVRPVGCQGQCRGGVTVVLPGGEAIKAADIASARACVT